MRIIARRKTVVDLPSRLKSRQVREKNTSTQKKDDALLVNGWYGGEGEVKIRQKLIFRVIIFLLLPAVASRGQVQSVLHIYPS